MEKSGDNKNCSAVVVGAGDHFVDISCRNTTVFAIKNFEWDDEVVKNMDGTVKNPFDMLSVYLVSFLVVLCCFGVPLNLEIILRIVYNKVLRPKPRYILQLSTTFSSLFTLLTNAIEIAHFVFGPNDAICHIFMFIIGLSFGAYLFNFLLSLIDCFVAITFPLWHRQKVTPRPVIFWLIVLNVTLMLTMKWMYVGRVIPIRCAIQIVNVATVRLILFILFIFCTIFLCLDYVLTWRKLPRSSIPVPAPRNRISAVVPSELEAIEMDDLIGPSSSTNIRPSATHHQDAMTVHTSIRLVRRMESKATQTFFVDFIPLFLLPLPGLLFFFFYFTMCPSLYGKEVCNDLVWLIPYVGGLMSVHAVVNPILSLCLNKDFTNKPSPLLRILLITRSARHQR